MVTIDITSDNRINGHNLDQLLRQRIEESNNIGGYTIKLENYQFTVMTGKYYNMKSMAIYILYKYFIHDITYFVYVCCKSFYVCELFKLCSNIADSLWWDDVSIMWGS